MSGESVNILNFVPFIIYHIGTSPSVYFPYRSSGLFSLRISYCTALFFLPLLPKVIGNSQWYLWSHGSHAFISKYCHCIRKRGGKINVLQGTCLEWNCSNHLVHCNPGAVFGWFPMLLMQVFQWKGMWQRMIYEFSQETASGVEHVKSIELFMWCRMALTREVKLHARRLAILPNICHWKWVRVMFVFVYLRKKPQPLNLIKTCKKKNFVTSS